MDKNDDDKLQPSDIKSVAKNFIGSLTAWQKLWTSSCIKICVGLSFINL